VAEVLLQLNGISKSFPGVKANENISFEINSGEIHALLGENGAGKSTLVKMIYGLMQPDLGNMRLSSESFRPSEPSKARQSGIAMVFQHFSLFDALNVAENIALGMENPPKINDLSEKIENVSKSYGLPLDPKRLVGQLSAGERQRVEIIRCLLQNPKLLIMDEPTSVLTPNEVKTLFETLLRLKEEGKSILYISHKLEEIREICDFATILRNGEKVGSCTPKNTSAKQIGEMMVGKSFSSPSRENRVFGEKLLKVSNLSIHTKDFFGTSLSNINFSVRVGEILGIGGVAGNGQDELLSALSGEEKTSPSTINILNDPIGKLAPNERRGLGLRAAPEERLGHAAAPSMTLIENTLMTSHSEDIVNRWGIINFDNVTEETKDIVAEFDVRTPTLDNAAASLSGGNLQKFVIGREILKKPRVFVVNQPTWGVDAAAAAFIRQSILNLASHGSAVVVISQDLDELFEICDTFAVLTNGRLSKSYDMRNLSSEDVGLLMGGSDLDLKNS
jgi:simple sugar transport system ATP-binding protein